ncbi:MAG: hypothetical protein ACREEM_46455, partial [Blastocatellia bacterium]
MVMSEAHALKIQLVEIINKLPDDKLQGVLDFVNSLLNQKGGISQNGAFPAGRDPLLDFIGIADGGLL